MNSKYLPLLATIVIFILSYAVCAMQYPNMLSTRVVGNLLTDNAFLGIAAVGMTFVIISGGIDLSIGSVIAFTGVFLAVILQNTSIHPLLAFALVLVITTALARRWVLSSTICRCRPSSSRWPACSSPAAWPSCCRSTASRSATTITRRFRGSITSCRAVVA
jgi:hypothetical protein